MTDSIFGSLDHEADDERLIAGCVPYSAPNPAVENEYSEIFWALFDDLDVEIKDGTWCHQLDFSVREAFDLAHMAVVDLNQIDPSDPAAWGQFLTFCRSHLRAMLKGEPGYESH